MSLYVTYDNAAAHDGIGAQVHRILCVMALARQFRLPYLHTFVKRVRYQGHSSRQLGTRDQDFVQKWDRFLNLGSGHQSPESCGIEFAKVRHRVKLRLWSLPWLAGAAASGSAGWPWQTRGRHELVRIKSAFPIVNRFPAAFELLRDDLRAQYEATPKPAVCFAPECLNVAVHIRRGDVTPASRYACRFVPNHVYVRVMQQIVAATPGWRVQFHVYSEGDVDNPRAGFEELTTVPNVVLHLNEDVFSTFHHLVRSDVLVLGVSSFSFVAGLYHRGPALNFPRHNPQLPHWIRLSASGRFGSAELVRSLAQHPGARRAA
jgi:hypothetical protein